MGRPPLRQTPTRPDVDEPVKANQPKKKTRIRKNAAMRSLLDIDADIMAKLHAQGIDLQWVTDLVLGQAAPQARMAYEINAWEPVTPDMFESIFDGVFTKKGHKGEINYEGLVLMWRPMELTEEAKAEEYRAQQGALAAQAAMIKGGQAIQGLAPGFEADHPSALAKNKLTRTIERPMEIPTD